MSKSSKNNKLYGIIDAIVQSVRDNSIDIHYVFTKEFAAEYGYNEQNPQEFFGQLRNNWYDSLPYINSVEAENREAELGCFVVADGTPYDGIEVACMVMRNIFADFPLTGEMFMQEEYSKIIAPNILFDTDDLWEAKCAFEYHTPEDNVIQFAAGSNLVGNDIKHYASNSKTDLMGLFEVIEPWQNGKEDEPPIIHSLKIDGFMASLIYAMFRDAARRKIFYTNWFEVDLDTMEELTLSDVTLYSSDLPTNLHIASYKVHEAYIATAIDALQTKLSKYDAAYEEAPEYTIRKMLDIELRQREHLNESPLWRAFPGTVQQMLRERLDLFITYLYKQCGIEEPKSEQIVAEQAVVAEDSKIEDNASLPFLVPERLAEIGVRSIDEFAKMYHAAVKKDAPKLGEFLTKYGELGVLDLKGKGKKEVFEGLKAYFKEELKYGYTNFTLCYKGFPEEK